MLTAFRGQNQKEKLQLVGELATGLGTIMMREIAEEKRDERRKKMRRIRQKRRLVITAVIASLVLLAWLGFLFSNSSFFDLKEFEVSGNNHLPEEKIIALSGVNLSSNLLKISLTRVEENILADPWVEDVRASRALPGKLKIEVTERKVIAAVAVGESYVLVDKDGMALEARTTAEELTLPVIREVKLDEAKIGLMINSKTLKNALVCLAYLDPELKEKINLVSASSIERLSLYTTEGVEVLYGKAEQMSEKNFVLKKILFEEGGKVIFVDIRIASNPAVRRLKQ